MQPTATNTRARATLRAPRLRHQPDPKKMAQEVIMLDLLTAIEARLTGRNVPRTVGSSSFNRFCIATLCSRRPGEHEGAQHAMEMRNPRRMGARFHLRRSDLAHASLGIEFRFNVYYPVYPTWEEFSAKRTVATVAANPGSSKPLPDIDLPRVESRLSCHHVAEVDLAEVSRSALNELSFAIPSLLEARASAAQDSSVLRMRPAESERDRIPNRILKIPQSIYSQPQPAAEYDRLVKAFPGAPVIPPWSAQMFVTLSDIDDDTVEVSVYFENTTEQEEFNSLWKGFFHDCQFEIKVRGAPIVPQLLRHMAEQDYRVASHVRATGIHCPVACDDDLIFNLQLPSYVLPEQEHKKRGGEGCLFAALAGPRATNLLLQMHREMVEYADWWAARYTQFIPEPSRQNDPLVRESFDKAVATFREEATRFRQGIDALERDTRALRAFQLANEAIGNSNKKFKEWRPFQLVFFVSLLKDVVARENPAVVDGRDFVDVLWFPTGGGKTETYLGLISFTLIYDRLRGKERGVSAWVKFPLRMLSLDQLDRFTRVLLVLNDIHEREGLRGDKFEIGYYMGDRNTPNRWRDSEQHQMYGLSPAELAQKYAAYSQKEKVTDAETIARTVFEKLDEKATRRFRLLEKCARLDCGKDVYVWPNPETERVEIHCPTHGRLPVQFVDEEIYHRVPSVVISTIDKLAIIAYNDNIRNLLVRPVANCSLHGYLPSRTCPSCDRLPEGRARGTIEVVKKEQFYDPAPAVQVQDELHLLKEQLGSYNSHYESLVDHLHTTLLNDPKYKVDRPLGRTKIIGATATISEYEQQVAQLYGRKGARRFPSPGPQRTETFYSIDKPTGRRILSSLWPVNMSGVTAMNEAFVSYWFRFLELYNNPKLLASVLQEAGVDADAIVAPNRELADALLDVLDKAGSTVAYYTNKQKAHIASEQFTTALPQAGEDFRPELKPQLVALQSETLTGDSEFREIRRIKSRLEGGRIGTKEWLAHLAATSIISHGVDVGRLNFILFAGMPADTAEYIQASSRVGRQDLGISIVLHDTARDRDELHFINHRLYHEHQEFHVHGVALNRFSKYLVNRTFPGLLVALIRLYYNPIQPNEEARHVFDMRDGRPLLDALQDRSVREKLVPILVQFIGRGLTDEDYLRSTIQSVWDQMTKEGVSRRTKGKELATLFPHYRPLTNHREIETPFPIGLDPDSDNFSRNSGWTPEGGWRGGHVDEAPQEADAPAVEYKDQEAS